ncbi:hypothetical protein L1049_026654 [Liquidambar formosana]|uniref:BHLH domain-containing protein n=1 Tax=Liquidambar formosana TaxID=63359 RepID=A0AAP0R6L4_LIQFO
MESANLHHQHQLQGQLVIGSSSLPTTPSWYGVGNNHAWSSNTILNNTANFNQNINRDSLFDSRDSRQKNDTLVPQVNSSMIQDLGFHWTSNVASFTGQSAQDLHLAKTKEELSDTFPKFTEMMNSSSSIEDLHLPPTSYIKNEHKDFDDLSEKLLLKTLSNHQPSAGGFYSNSQNCPNFGGVAMPSRGSFSQIFPSINISNLNQSASAISNTLDMNMQALDLLTSPRLTGSISQVSHDNLGLVKDSLSFGLHHMQQLTHMPSSNPNKISPFINGVTEAKRPSSYMEPKASKATAPKKSRMESRASCPPFKQVRKEKLGDRIAALQQLVAPFGKTDTASVLMEAIGYIKFLQNQVETLSVPYMKSSRNRSSRTMQAGQTEDKGNEEPKPDLQSRGLCLVPLSCMSYITNDGGGGGIWQPNDYSGGT